MIAAATDHARQRLHERYGVEPTRETVMEHLALILAGESFRVSVNSSGRETHRVGHEGRQFLVLYSPGCRRIVTYLPKQTRRQ